MTKMTLLHFASPFAFSMPAPVQVTHEDRGGAGASASITATAAEGTGPSSGSRSSIFGEAAPTASEGAGFEASVYDAVLRRYREQDGSGSDAAGDTSLEQDTA